MAHRKTDPAPQAAHPRNEGSLGNCWPFLGAVDIINRVGESLDHRAFASSLVIIYHTARCEIAPVFKCQHCGRSSESVQSATARLTCPYCGKEGSASPKKHPPSDGCWKNVARVANLAEAGFLADDLIASNIDARIYQSDEFRAIDGNWAATYLIQVPTEQAHTAAARIRRHMFDDEGPSDFDAGQLSDAGDLSIGPATWRPMALVVLAGMASFVLGQRFAAIDGQRRPPARDSLSVAVDAIGRPLMTDPVPGKPRYRLSFDWRHDTWKLDADRNGDGHFDERRLFRTAEVGR